MEKTEGEKPLQKKHSATTDLNSLTPTIGDTGHHATRCLHGRGDCMKMTKQSPFKGRNIGPKSGEIWYADALMFNDGIHSKDRPVLIKKRNDQMFECYKCTSQAKDFRERFEIKDLDEAGLDHRTFIDYDIIHIPRTKLVYCLGRLSDDDRTAFGRI